MAVRIEPHAEPIPGYTLLERIGAGGFGEVWKAEAPGEIFKAIKFIHGDLRSPDNDLVRYAEQELKSLKRSQAGPPPLSPGPRSLRHRRRPAHDRHGAGGL